MRLAAAALIVGSALSLTACGIVTIDRGSGSGSTSTTIPATPQTQVASQRGIIVIRYAGGIQGWGVVETITPDGLVQFESSSKTSAPHASPILGQGSAQDLRGLLTGASQAGFFDWKATYRPATVGIDPLTQGLEIWSQQNRDGSWTLHNKVTVVAGGKPPTQFTKLFAQCAAFAAGARVSLFPTETARAILAAKALAAKVRWSYSVDAWAKGPAISQEVIPGWAADIAHNPRQAVDDLPQNQALSLRQGKVKHFVEISPEGDFIRAM
jgi:hypothetical protein